MAEKEEFLEFEGTVTELLPEGRYRVKLDNEHMVLAYTAWVYRVLWGKVDEAAIQQDDETLY